MQHLKRGEKGCLCCANLELRPETTVISPFLAKRAWNGKPDLIDLLFCEQCGFRFFDRGLSEAEASSYYSGYWDEVYFRERHKFEPFYTAKVYRYLTGWARSSERRATLSRTFERAGMPKAFASALDFGGGRGYMLLDIDAPVKATFDVGGGDTEPGIERISDQKAIGNDWELVLSCQVLEHVTNPLDVVEEIKQMVAKGGWFYAEVPDEIWVNKACPSKLRDTLLRLLAKTSLPLLAADIVSTGFRTKLGVLPPMGFVPMREHLNYFTVESISALLTRAGLHVKWAGKNEEYSICAFATNL